MPDQHTGRLNTYVQVAILQQMLDVLSCYSAVCGII